MKRSVGIDIVKINRSKILLSVFAISATLTIAWYLGHNRRQLSSQVSYELHDISANQLKKIVLSPPHFSSDDWQVIVTDKTAIEDFKKALILSDDTQVSGHSIPIAEWTMTLHFGSMQFAQYQAAIFNQQKDDLFIIKESYTRTEKGNYTTKFHGRARIPNIAEWIIAHAPLGKM